MADGESSIFAKLKAFAVRDWLLIVLGLAALVVAWLIYRNQAQGTALGSTAATTDSAGAVPAGGSGQPIWPSDGSGQNSDFWNNFFAYIQSTQTPNPPPTATPSTTGGTLPPGYVVANGSQTLSQIAQAHGATATDIVYNSNNGALKTLLSKLHIPFTGQNGYGTYKPAAGTVIFVPTKLPTPLGRNPNDPIGFM